MVIGAAEAVEQPRESLAEEPLAEELILDGSIRAMWAGERGTRGAEGGLADQRT